MTRMSIPAQNINEVIFELDKIIEECKVNKNRAGYFAALYRKVTLKVKDEIQSEKFDDNKRIEKLDVVFANRYLTAYQNYAAGKRVSQCWELAFDTNKKWSPIVLQHLLLGMNAHINLDLGLAAVETSRSSDINSLKNDFDRINLILASLVDEVSDKLARVWPLLKMLDFLGGRTDEDLINFSMQQARDQAWKNAVRFSKLDDIQFKVEESKLDNWVSIFGNVIVNPGWILNIAAKIVRLGELKGVSRIIEILE